MAARRGGGGGGGRPKRARAAKRRASGKPERNPSINAANSVNEETTDSTSMEVSTEATGVEAVDPSVDDTLQMPNESRLQLPDLPSGARGVRRRRRRKLAEAAAAAETENGEEVKALPLSEIERLTVAYRAGGDKARELVSKIEVEPNFMFRDGQADGEYELAAAIIGTGKANKQGLYVLPYLQSSHMLLLSVILLGTFVYYPGFPLTEGSDELRGLCRLGLALTYTVNFGLAVYSFAEAKRRKQPPSFWFFKVALLGNIALQELRSNAPLDTEVSKSVKRKGRARK